MRPLPALSAFAAACFALTACGGADADTDPASPDRVAAVRATAHSDTNACAAIRPFYWEVGDRSEAKASGSVGAVTASTVMAVASASKWLYSAYVLERRPGGVPTAEDVAYLSFRSGFAAFDRCQTGETVGACAADPANSTYNPAYDGKFFYSGAHMQQHADQLMGLGAFLNGTLAAELRGELGTDIQLTFTQPQPAGGVQTSAADYARFLRKLMRNELQLGRQLGSNATCTNPATCSTAVSTPIPTTESWHYALGHWVEDDPAVGDGAFSSPGAFGFYPWISANRQAYGVLARVKLEEQAGYQSARCGRLIRKAWETGSPL